MQAGKKGKPRAWLVRVVRPSWGAQIGEASKGKQREAAELWGLRAPGAPGSGCRAWVPEGLRSLGMPDASAARCLGLDAFGKGSPGARPEQEAEEQTEEAGALAVWSSQVEPKSGKRGQQNQWELERNHCHQHHDHYGRGQ